MSYTLSRNAAEIVLKYKPTYTTNAKVVNCFKLMHNELNKAVEYYVHGSGCK